MQNRGRNIWRYFQRASLYAASLLMLACASFGHHPEQVLIRDPLLDHYTDPEQASQTARLQWEFAVMSENAYREGLTQNDEAAHKRIPHARLSEANVRRACADDSLELPLSGWRKWDFPGPELKQRLLDEGLYMEVQEKWIPPHTIAVVFEGSKLTRLSDWKANMNWALRFIPTHKDQYVLTASIVLDAFYAELAKRKDELQFDPNTGMLHRRDGSPVRIVSAGHSLGAGLAQYFAYTFRRPAAMTPGPRVTEVFAFDPSPVTGWFSAADQARDDSVTGLQIRRIFEDGEILSYLRLLTSRLGMSAQNPAIWEYRYNFEKGINSFDKHSIRRLACGLTMAAKPWGK